MTLHAPISFSILLRILIFFIDFSYKDNVILSALFSHSIILKADLA